MHRIPLRYLVMAVAAAIPLAATAHHGWAWTESGESRLTGRIEAIHFGNPHMRLQVRASDGLWEVDLSPPVVARRSGFGPDAAKVGDQVSLTGHRARDRATRAFKGETVTVRGKTFDVYPDRAKTLKPAA